MSRWALFQDHRGALLCEQVDEGLQCWTKVLPKKRSSDQPPETKIQVIFLESHYSRDDYLPSAFEPPAAGFSLDRKMVYMKTNKWGPVTVIAFVEDDEQGRKLNTELQKYSSVLKDECDRTGTGTDRLVEMARRIGSMG